MKTFNYLLVIALLIISCQSNETSENSDSSSPEETVADSNTDNTAPELPFFTLEQYKDSLDNPRSVVSIDLAGKKLKVTDAVGCEKIDKSDYGTYQIPTDAFDAVGGWWAGSGEYFYLIKSAQGDFYQVMKAVVDEQQPGGYNYISEMSFVRKLK